MLFSIIVPFLNEERYIEGCIESLVGQDFDKNEYEVIFIDNGSTDLSVEIVEKNKEIKLLFEKKPNPYNARNKGLKEAKGEIIAFTDADCVVSEDWLRQIQQIFENSKIYALLGRRDFPVARYSWLGRMGEFENERVKYIFQEMSKEYYYGFTNNMAVRKLVFDQIGEFKVDLPVGGDSEMIRRIADRFPDKLVVFSSEASVLHLEIEHFGQWLKKLRVYGENLPLNYKYCVFKDLGWRRNLQILLSLANKPGFRLVNLVILIPFFICWLSFNWGLMGFRVKKLLLSII